VEQLRAAGAVIVGKTHLHPLAYGITGENAEFGDCLQPRDSGALHRRAHRAAQRRAWQEGSAVAAIGTDTGGSIRAPAALCGLARLPRLSRPRRLAAGGAHLAQSFDTMGWLFRDLQDAPYLAASFGCCAFRASRNLNGSPLHALSHSSTTAFLHDCEPESRHQLSAASFANWRILDWKLDASRPAGGPTPWIFMRPCRPSKRRKSTPVTSINSRPPIRDRLKWGAGLTPSEVSALRQRLEAFRARIDEILAAHELVLLPLDPRRAPRPPAPDHKPDPHAPASAYTAPFSLAGTPTVAIPCAHGGMQLAAARGNDEPLLALAAQIGAHRRASLAV